MENAVGFHSLTTTIRPPNVKLPSSGQHADGVAIHAVLWYDKMMVSLVFMYCDVDPVTKVKRFYKYDKV